MATCFNTTRPTKFQRRLASSDCQSLKWSSWIATSHPQAMRPSKSTSTSSYVAPCVRHEQRCEMVNTATNSVEASMAQPSKPEFGSGIEN